ncbi:MAG: lytic murein transglycosylase B [Methylococcales bacterium]|nr:lytic murein transglycosylase B [Methylococcales bacterium]
MIKKIILSSTLLMGMIISSNSVAKINQTPEVDRFINMMRTEHDFKPENLTALFQKVDTKQSILKAISRPAEKRMEWHQYRKIFLTKKRIAGGVKFWKKHQQVLENVEKKYGVPWQIIVAIIGVETQYGGNTGSYRVIDALSTLAFSYPKRSTFFTKELKHFLLLCREEKMNPLKPKGSYAGAMGLPQFMPSSYRNYAADYENDHIRNIWTNPADAIASVGHYLLKYGWQKNEAIAYKVTVTGNNYTKALFDDLKPQSTVAQLQALNIDIPPNIPPQALAKLLEYQQVSAPEFWVGLTNFYVITRYNHSQMYALAVYQLGDAILEKAK